MKASLKVINNQRLIFFLPKRRMPPKNGTDQKRGLSGIGLQEKNAMQQGLIKNTIAFTVGNLLNQSQYSLLNIAQTVVNRIIDESKKRTWKSVLALVVVLNFRLINIQSRVIVQGCVPHNIERNEDVYDITVEDNPEFVANNILIHNSDAKRYFLISLFKAEFEQYKSRSKKRSGSVAVPG